MNYDSNDETQRFALYLITYQLVWRGEAAPH
jgi:hypothetical protein